MSSSRPTTVVAATMTAWAMAMIDGTVGVVALVMSADEASAARLGTTAERLALIGSLLMVLALLTGALAFMLPNGTPGVRMIVSTLLLARLAAQGTAWGVLGWSVLGSISVSALLAVVALVLLWTARSTRWFARS